MNPSTDNNKKSMGWKFVIASFSLTSFISLVNFFSSKEATTENTTKLDELVNSPLPTLIPVASIANEADVPSLREVAISAPTPTPNSQNPVIERVTIGSSGGGSRRPSTTTSSSR